MKIQIDTNAKTIKIEGNVKLSYLFNQLQKFFPDGEWEDYSLETNTVIHNWGSPIIINQPHLTQQQPYPWWTGDVFCGGTITVSGANEFGVTTTSNAAGPIYVDMSNEPIPEVCTSGYAQFESGIYNFELN